MGKLRLTSFACIGPWGIGAKNLLNYMEETNPKSTASPPLPAVSGFIYSNYNPLVNQVIQNLHEKREIAGGPQTAIALGSYFGDTSTIDLTSKGLVSGNNKMNPLMFFQSVPNSILGHLTKEYRITGLTSCISCSDHILKQLLDMANVMIQYHGMEQVIVMGISLAGSARANHIHGYEIADAVVALAIERSQSTASDSETDIVFEPTTDGWIANPATKVSFPLLHHAFPGLQEMLEVCYCAEQIYDEKR